MSLDSEKKKENGGRRPTCTAARGVPFLRGYHVVLGKVCCFCSVERSIFHCTVEAGFDVECDGVEVLN